VFSVWTEGSDDVPLFLSNTDGSGLTQLTHNGRQNYLPAWSPDGMRISFIFQIGDTRTAEIYTIGVDETNEAQLTENDAYEYGTSWSGDGETIVFVSERGGEWQIYTMDSDGDNQPSGHTGSRKCPRVVTRRQSIVVPRGKRQGIDP
jgi:TolB protein